MRIFVGQIYVEPGVSYPFSHHFQNWLGTELSSRVRPSSQFLQDLGSEYDIVFNVSAKTSIEVSDIKGPTIFKKDKDIEYAIYLPHDGGKVSGAACLVRPFELLLNSIVGVLRSLSIDVTSIMENFSAMVEVVRADPVMIDERKIAQ